MPDQVTSSPPPGVRLPAIGFSGVDGAGKSTQVERLASWLLDRGLPVTVTKVRLHATKAFFRLSDELFADPYAYHPTIPAPLREFVVACDLVEHYVGVVRPLEEAGRLVLWDRCVHCYRVFSKVFGADIEWVTRMQSLVPEPAVTFLLDLSVEEAQRRLRARADKPIKTDESMELSVALRARYLEYAQGRPEIEVITAAGDPGRLASWIQARLVSRFSWLQEPAPPVSGGRGGNGPGIGG